LGAKLLIGLVLTLIISTKSSDVFAADNDDVIEEPVISTITIESESEEEVVTETEEKSDPRPEEILEYVLETGDVNYLMQYQNLLPSSMVSELLKVSSQYWEQMVRENEEALEKELEQQNSKTTINGPQEYHLTKSAGVFNGPSGKETYYNLNMSGIVNVMRSMGYDEETYPYWVREDGVKMLGDYVMVAAAFSIRPRGTVVETSLGTGLVCDTGGFAASNQTQLDIAVNW
jgi:hypothetical protein